MPFFKINKLENRWEWVNEPKPHVDINQTLVVETDRAATIIVEQLIDEMVMIDGVRYPLQIGSNTLTLKPMRIYNPTVSHYDGTPASYGIAVRIYAAGTEPVTQNEIISFRKPE